MQLNVELLVYLSSENVVQASEKCATSYLTHTKHYFAKFMNLTEFFYKGQPGNKDVRYLYLDCMPR